MSYMVMSGQIWSCQICSCQVRLVHARYGVRYAVGYNNVLSDMITKDLWNWWPLHFFSCGQFWITELNLLHYDHSNYKYQYSKRHCSQLYLLTEIFEPNPWFKKIYHHNPCIVSIIGTYVIQLSYQSPLMKIYQIPM